MIPATQQVLVHSDVALVKGLQIAGHIKEVTLGTAGLVDTSARRYHTKPVGELPSESHDLQYELPGSRCKQVCEQRSLA
jgi:hypothetical protein